MGIHQAAGVSVHVLVQEQKVDKTVNKAFYYRYLDNVAGFLRDFTGFVHAL